MIVQEEVGLPDRRHHEPKVLDNSYIPKPLTDAQEAAGALLDLISPYYKSFPTPGGIPTFRKTLTSEEIQNVLMGVHNIVSELLFSGD